MSYKNIQCERERERSKRHCERLAEGKKGGERARRENYHSLRILRGNDEECSQQGDLTPALPHTHNQTHKMGSS